MTFIGVISEHKSFERIKEKLENKEMKFIHIHKNSIENIKNIKFETIIINTNLESFQQKENILEQICFRTKYLGINTDQFEIQLIKSK